MSENENNQYRLLSPWAYVGYGILFTLPVIGWILAIVFALNDDNRIAATLRAVTGAACWWRSSWRLSCRLLEW